MEAGKNTHKIRTQAQAQQNIYPDCKARRLRTRQLDRNKNGCLFSA